MKRATAFTGELQLETLAEAQERNLQRIEALIDRAPDIAAALEACDLNARCGCVICAVCALNFRDPLIRKLLALAMSYPGQHRLVTIFLEAFPAGKLSHADIKRAHDRLRKRLERSGFAGSILIGGTEAGWDSTDRVWTLHAHLTAIDVPPRAWRKLRKALRGVGPKFPVKVQRLRNPEGQISYSAKFVTYFRPGARRGGTRPPAVPLPRDRLVELAEWWSGYRFDDFIFLFGAKRRGGQVVVDTHGNSSTSSNTPILRKRRIRRDGKTI